jgi:two-component system, NtrC family, sensor histidine kinase KinB
MSKPPLAEQSLVDMRTSALLRIASAIETAATLDELLMLALNEFAHLLDIPIGGILLVNEAGTAARLVSSYPPRVTMPPPLDLSQTTYLRQVAQHRQPIQITDVTVDLPGRNAQDTPQSRFVAALLDEDQIRTVLLVPLVAQDKLIGFLLLASNGEPRPFPESEVALARLMAGQLAAAITSFRITEQAQRRSAELATLNDIAAAVTSSLNTREVYHLVMGKLNEYFQVDAGSLLMVDPETDELVFVMTLEAGEEKLFGVRVPRGMGIVGHVAETQQYAIVDDAQNDPRFFANVSDSVGYEVHTILCVPIVIKGRTIGVIELLNKRDGHFTEEEANRLTRMAATIGVAIENARLFQQVTTVRDRVEAIVNSTADGILMADMHGTVVTANPTAAQLFGLRTETLFGKQLDVLLAELHARATNVNVPSWLNDNNAHEIVELELGGSQRRFIRHFILPVRETNGAEIGRLAMFQDFSKERELAQLREDYTGMLVHDLRAPLTAIMNGIMMVKRGLGGPISDQQHELLGIAHQGSQTMLEMVNTLLDIAKMEQGHMALNLEPLSPYALVDETLDRLRGNAQSQRIDLAQQLSVGLPLIEADREKLVRVLQNLLDNAIKFSPTGATVTFGATALRTTTNAVTETRQSGTLHLPDLDDREWIIFWVRDRGPGIPPQYHERIFEKFGQVRERKVRGTGLGLTFCKLAVESHGGRIWLQSAEGAGSTFALALPLTQD